MKKKSLFSILFVLMFIGLFQNNSFANRNKVALKLDRSAYGFCLQDGSWGASPSYGLYSFHMDVPSTITKLWATDNKTVNAGAYYDGYYYVQRSTIVAGSYTNMEFGRYNATSGTYEKIADWNSKMPKFKDLTIDYSTTPPSLIGFEDVNTTVWRLVKIDMATGNITNLASGNSSGRFVALACKLDGTLYTMTLEGRLQTVNKTTGAVTNVSNVANDFMPLALQSMEFDHTDGTLYWACFASDEGKFGSVDLSTGLLSNSAMQLGANAQFTGLYIPFILGNEGAPSGVTNLKVVTALNGGKSATISWTNPNIDNLGSNLISIDSVKLYRNDKLIHTIVNPACGSNYSYVDDSIIASNNYVYKVTAQNSAGMGALAKFVVVFVGEDIPKAPSNPTISKEETKAIITWTAPIIGINGGWINSANLKYKIVRNPGGIVVADNIVDNTYTDTTIKNLNIYSYTITSKTTVGGTQSITTSGLSIGNPLNVPYKCNFDVDESSVWTVLDVNNDAKTWVRQAAGYFQYSYHSTNAANDRLISPSFYLEVGKYKLEYDYRSTSSSYAEKMKVYFGSGATIEDQNIEIKDYSNIVVTTFTRDAAVIDITSAGVYNFSFHAYSDKDRSSLIVDNIEFDKMVDNDLLAIDVSGGNLIQTAAATPYVVKIKNTGSLPQNSYSISLIDENNIELASKIVTDSILSGQTKSITINWTPQKAGSVKLRGKVTLSSDEKSFNDVSEYINVEIFNGADGNVVSIGNGTSSMATMPINISQRSGTTQSIYLKSEIGLKGGLINKIVYVCQNDNVNAAGLVKPVKIFIANTDSNTLTNGWIKKDGFQQVFDGNIFLEGGKSNIILNLDSPFVYSGSNLCVMVVRPTDSQTFINVKFYYTTVTQDRSRLFTNASTPFDWTQAGSVSKSYPNIVFQIDTLSENGRPASAMNLKAEVGQNGVKSASISWTYPSKNNIGGTLSSITESRLYRNDTLIKTISTPVMGSSETFLDNGITKNGFYTYKVVVVNANFIGAPSSTTVFIGEDIPFAPTAVQLSYLGQNGKLDWVAPTKGINGGWLNSAQISYTIKRIQDSIVLTNNYTHTSFVDSSHSILGKYSYSIQAKTNAGESALASSNVLLLGPALMPPYTCDFSTAEQFNYWTVIDANGDNNTWNLDLTNKLAKYSFHSTNAGDDWLISPPLNLEIGKYQLSFDSKSGTVSNERMKVFIGKGATVANQLTMLNDMTVRNTSFETTTIDIEITTKGLYNFSFYAFSPKALFSLNVDNIKFIKLFENDLAAVSVNGTTLPIANTEYTYNIAVKNSGYKTQNSYTVQLLDAENNVLASKISTLPIEANQTVENSVSWTPLTQGIMHIKGKVILQNDENSSNDISSALQLDIQEDVNKMITIGEGVIEEKTMPINFYFKSSVSQSLYLKSEIGVNGGVVKKIIYKYNNQNQIGLAKHIQIYMANAGVSTDINWVKADNLIKVYDGIANVGAGKGELIISLNQPFLYAGENLNVMVIRSLETQFKDNVNFYVSNKSTNRTRLYVGDSEEFNWTQAGTTSTKIPNTTLQIDVTEGGKLEGLISSKGNPVSGVKVKISQYNITSETDADGKYKFDYVPAGTYHLIATKHGYKIKLDSNIAVVVGQVKTHPMDIQSLAQFKLSGLIKNYDGEVVVGANITVNGYDNYTATTNANGTFEIANLYQADNYEIKVSKKNYVSHSSNFNISESNLELPTIVLQDMPNAPIGVIATKKDDSQVDISWIAPSEIMTYRYDDGNIVGSLGFENGGVNGVLGSVHTQNTTLTSMSWYTLGVASSGGPHHNVNIFVIDLDANGKPTKNVIFKQMNVPNKDDQWMTFKFPQLLDCPRGFMIAISYDGFAGIGRDAGTSKIYPFVPNANYYSSNYTEGKYTVLSGNMSYNIAIRAQGFEDIAKTPKSVLGYKVWRLLSSDTENNSKWTLLTNTSIHGTAYRDESLGSAETGSYVYAIEANYSNGITSSPTFSNIITKGLEVNANINVNTNTPSNEPDGAVVTLTNNNNDAQYVYTSVVSNGKAIFPNVWKGIYKVVVSKTGFETIEARNVEINNNGLELSYVLQELINKPSGLKVSTTTLATERYFTWNQNNTRCLHYEIYLNDSMVGQTSNKNFTFTNLKNGNHTAGVKAVFVSGKSEMVSIEFLVNISSTILFNDYCVNIYPNPVKDKLHIEGDYYLLQIYNMEGKLVLTTNNNAKEIDLSLLPNGSYTITFYNGKRIVHHKIIK